MTLPRNLGRQLGSQMWEEAWGRSWEPWILALCAHACLWAMGKARGGKAVERPLGSRPAPLRPPCHLQRSRSSEGLPQEPPGCRKRPA